MQPAVQPDPPAAGVRREFGTQEQRRAWRVRQRYLPDHPTVAALLDQARGLEAAMRAAGIDVEPASVLIRTDGLTVTVTVTVTVHDTRASAAGTARARIDQLATHAGMHPDELGRPGEVVVHPGWRPRTR